MTIAAVGATGSPKIAADNSMTNIGTEEFLNLLVSQLRNQSPLDPADTKDLMAQMMSYASYNQQLITNGSLQDIRTLLQAEKGA